MNTWYRRIFKVIDISEAKKKAFIFDRNIYGDEINHLNCRSIWFDKRGKKWRIKQLNI